MQNRVLGDLQLRRQQALSLSLMPQLHRHLDSAERDVAAHVLGGGAAYSDPLHTAREEGEGQGHL